MSTSADAWKSEKLVHMYLEGIRGGLPFAREQLKVVTDLLEGMNRPIRRFADLGCGGGILAATLLGSFPEAEGLMVDFSEAMFKEAAKRLAEYSGQLHWQIADLGEASWKEKAAALAPYDAVVSGFAIHHLTDERKQELYREIYSLLAPGGIFLNNEHVASPGHWSAELSDELFIDALYSYHRAGGGTMSRTQVANELVHRQDKQANLLAPVDEQCRWLNTIGFVEVDCYFKYFQYSIFGGRKPPI